MDFPTWRRAQAFSQELMVTTYWSDGLTEKKQRLRSFGAKRSIQSPRACVKNSERRQRQFPKNQAKLTRLFFRGSHPRPSRPIAALIRARPAAEMRRLPALIGKTFWPLAFA